MNWTPCLIYTLISMTSIRCEHNPRTYDGTFDHTDGVGPDVAIQRMSERSIPLEGAGQSLQEVQRRLHRDNEETLGDGDSQVNSRKGLGAHPSPSTDEVVFPGRVRRQSSQFVPNVPEECLKKGYCENLPDYPEDHVAAVIQSLGNATSIFHVEELDTTEITQRLGSPEETELCDYRLKVVIPKAAPDKDGKWHYILNLKNKVYQAWKVELCEKDKSPCSNLAYFYSGYEASCKQKFMLRLMVGLDAEGKKVENSYQLPSCCSCIVRQCVCP